MVEINLNGIAVESVSREFLAHVEPPEGQLKRFSGGRYSEEIYCLLLNQARQAALRSYSPYSQYPVGAALLTADGRLFTGCNVENASFGGTICAERTAIVKAVSEGVREFAAIAVFCKKTADGWPCGFCRQFISEFGLDIEVVTESVDHMIQVLQISELLPRSFGPAALGR